MTDWELGNDIMCNIVDKLKELAKEAGPAQPKVASLLNDIALDFGPLVNRLMNDDHNDDVGMCPKRDDSYRFFDGTSKTVYDPYNTIR